jgi:hypothetical protein
VDIQLALDVYQHAIQDNIETALIFASDLDFYPLFEALTQTKTTTILRYDVDKTSRELIQAADRAFPLSLNECLIGYQEYTPNISMFAANIKEIGGPLLASCSYREGNVMVRAKGETFYIGYDKHP